MRSLGISLRPDGFDFALCEGNAKKHLLAASGSANLSENQATPKELGQLLAAELKKQGTGKIDQITLVLPSTGTLYRELNLPFSERAKIEQVLKFEVESELYHVDIDEVICDFLELNDERATSTLLVAVQPKKGVGQALDAASGAGLDVPVVDMDLCSMASLATHLPSAENLEDPAGYRAVLHLGSMNSLLLIYSGTSLRTARALHLGWRELARDFDDPSLEAAAEDIPEIEAVPMEGTGEVSGVGEEAPADATSAEDGDEDDEEAPADPALGLFEADVRLPYTLSLQQVLDGSEDSAKEAFLQRIAGEIHRTLLSASIQIQDVHLTGADFPGLADALTKRLDIPASSWDLPADAVAFSASLRGLDVKGCSPMNMRQEEYRFTQGLERIERPLTFALVGLIAFFLVDGVSHFQQGRARMRDAAALDNPASLVSLAIGEIDRNLNKDLPDNPPKGWRVKTDLSAFPPERYMAELRLRVANSKRALDEEVGAAGVAMPESSLDAWRLVMNVLEEELGTDQGRWMVERIKLTSVDQKSKKSSSRVDVDITLSVMGDGLTASRRIESVKAAFKQKEWVTESPSIKGSLEPTKSQGGMTGTIAIQVSTLKAKEVDA
jgi:Tfp pilus assembly PilM family ATPase